MLGNRPTVEHWFPKCHLNLILSLSPSYMYVFEHNNYYLATQALYPFPFVFYFDCFCPCIVAYLKLGGGERESESLATTHEYVSVAKYLLCVVRAWVSFEYVPYSWEPIQSCECISSCTHRTNIIAIGLSLMACVSDSEWTWMLLLLVFSQHQKYSSIPMNWRWGESR